MNDEREAVKRTPYKATAERQGDGGGKRRSEAEKRARSVPKEGSKRQGSDRPISSKQSPSGNNGLPAFECHPPNGGKGWLYVAFLDGAEEIGEKIGWSPGARSGT